MSERPDPAPRSPRYARTRSRLGRHAAAGAFLGIVATILLLAPVASAGGPLGVTIKAPYSGVAYLDSQGSYSGIGCPGTGNLTYSDYFSLTTGRGGGGIVADSEPCASWVDEYHQQDMWFGLNMTPFVATTSVAHDHVRFHWTLSYDLLVNTTWSGGSATSYAYASVSLGAWVEDVTTGVNTGSITAFDNYTYLDDAKGTQQFAPGTYIMHVTMIVVVSFVAGDTYEFRSYAQSETRAETDGPLGSSNAALAQVVWPASGTRGKLVEISY